MVLVVQLLSWCNFGHVWLNEGVHTKMLSWLKLFMRHYPIIEYKARQRQTGRKSMKSQCMSQTGTAGTPLPLQPSDISAI